MKRIDRLIAFLWILTLLAVALSGCVDSISTYTPGLQSSPVPVKQTVIVMAAPNLAYANAQATKDAGQSQLLTLARRSTEVALDISKAANSAAAATQDYNRRQKLDLDYQATVISLNIAQANATQKSIAQQTQTAKEATAAAQNTAAAATRAVDQIHTTQTAQAQTVLDALSRQTAQAAAALTAYPLTATASAHTFNLTEAARAQGILAAQAAQTAQAFATQTAYPLTATPRAAAQAALLMQQYEREQQAFIKKIVGPVIPILVVIDLILLTLVLVTAYRRGLSQPWARRLQFEGAARDPGPMIMIDGVIVDHDPRPRPMLPAQTTLPQPAEPTLQADAVHVEIVSAAEAPFAHWVAEVEQQLGHAGGHPL